MSAILRPHQERLLEQIDAAIAGGCRRIVAQAPTGFGKTIVAAYRLRHIQDTGKRAIFLVPALSLVDQSIEKLYAEGVRDVGVIQAAHLMTNYARPIQIASVQTLMRREMPDTDEIIIDEVHRWYQFYPKLLRDPRFATTPIIGLSATPWTRGLGKYFDRLIMRPPSEGWSAYPNLRLRPFAPNTCRGRIQVQVRRAFLAAGDVVLSTTEVFDFTFARTRRVHWRRRHRWSVIRVLDGLCHRVGRAPTIGRPWLWRLKPRSENRAARLQNL